MTPSLIAFLCTGQDDTFDPLCDTDDLVLTALVLLGSFLWAVWFIAGKLSGQRWYVRIPVSVVAGVLTSWLVTAGFTEMAMRFLT